MWAGRHAIDALDALRERRRLVQLNGIAHPGDERGAWDDIGRLHRGRVQGGSSSSKRRA